MGFIDYEDILEANEISVFMTTKFVPTKTILSE
jgi:hypothetical protein